MGVVTAHLLKGDCFIYKGGSCLSCIHGWMLFVIYSLRATQP